MNAHLNHVTSRMYLQQVVASMSLPMFAAILHLCVSSAPASTDNSFSQHVPVVIENRTVEWNQ